MEINHVFFDLDHTLWDFETNSDKAFIEIFEHHNMLDYSSKFLNYYRPINQEYWRLYRHEKVTKDQLRYGRLKDTFNKIKLEVVDELINQLAIDYIDALPNYNDLFDGAIEILDYLRPKYELHIITNGFNEVQYRKMKASGLAPYFDKIITSEDAGVKKPNPIIFDYALNHTKAQKSNSIMIGDNWEADVMGAINFGLDAIYFNPGSEPVSSNVKSVQTLSSLKSYL